MILGVDWVRMHNPIVFYFAELMVSFKMEGKLITLYGPNLWEKNLIRW